MDNSRQRGRKEGGRVGGMDVADEGGEEGDEA